VEHEFLLLGVVCGGAHFSTVSARFDPGFAARFEMLEVAVI
jgi:hypothetical protein